MLPRWLKLTAATVQRLQVKDTAASAVEALLELNLNKQKNTHIFRQIKGTSICVNLVNHLEEYNSSLVNVYVYKTKQHIDT